MNPAPLPSQISARWIVSLLLLCCSVGPVLAAGGGGDDAPCDCVELAEEMLQVDEEAHRATELRGEDRPMSNLLQAFHNAMNYLYQPAMPDQKAIVGQRERERCLEICREKQSR